MPLRNAIIAIGKLDSGYQIFERLRAYVIVMLHNVH
jgi:hypothetical protein